MRYLTILSAILLLISCSSERELAKLRAKRPEWAKRKPVSDGYYTGVGSARKTINVDQYKQTAKKNALQNLAEEISINISGRSVLRQLEVDYDYTESFTSHIITSTDKELQGYELVDSYEDEQRYFIYYRLSKRRYQEIKQEKINQAIQKSKDKYLQAQSDYSRGAIKNAIIGEIMALDILRPYMHETLETRIDGKNVLLANEIASDLQNKINSITITPRYMQIEVTRGYPVLDDRLAFQVTDAKGHPISNMPLKSEFSEQTLVNERIYTDTDGLAQFEMERVVAKNRSGKYAVKPDIEKLLEASTSDITIREIVRRIPVPRSAIDINITSPAFSVLIDNENAANSSKQRLKTAMKELLVSDGFNTVTANEAADFIINMEASLSVEERYDGKYEARVTLSLRLSDRQENSLFNMNTKCTKAIHNDRRKVEKEAFKKGVNDLKDHIFEEMIYQLF